MIFRENFNIRREQGHILTRFFTFFLAVPPSLKPFLKRRGRVFINL